MSKFNVGDRVQITKTSEELRRENSYNGTLDEGYVGEIVERTHNESANRWSYKIAGDNLITGCWIREGSLSLSDLTRHKHHDTIVAWAKGNQIQYKESGSDVWHQSTIPAWSLTREYRVALTEDEEKILKLKKMIVDLEVALHALESK